MRPIRTAAAQWELEGPRMTGPMTSLNMLGGGGSLSVWERTGRSDREWVMSEKVGPGRPNCERIQRQSGGKRLDRTYPKRRLVR